MNDNILGVTFKQLQAFVAIAENGTFNIAADKLNISQPSISRHIKALEKKCGPLFVRRRGAKVQLSEAGRRLYENTPQLLKGIRSIGADLVEASGDSSTINIGAGEYLYGYLQDAVANFLAEMPLVHVDIRIINSESEGMQLLAKGTLDLFFVTRLVKPQRFDRDVMGETSMSLYATDAVIQAADQGEILPMIMPEIASPGEEFVKNCLTTFGIGRYAVAARSQHVKTSRLLCMRGIGAALMYDELVRSEVASGKLIKLPYSSIPVYRCCFKSEASYTRPVIEYFRDFAAARFKEL